MSFKYNYNLKTYKEIIKEFKKRNYKILSLNVFYNFANEYVEEKELKKIDFNNKLLLTWKNGRRKTGKNIGKWIPMYKKLYLETQKLKLYIKANNLLKLKQTDDNIKWILEREFKKDFNINYINNTIKNELLKEQNKQEKYIFTTHFNKSNESLV